MYINHCKNCNVDFTIVGDTYCAITYTLDDEILKDLILHLNTEMTVIHWVVKTDKNNWHSAMVPYLFETPEPKDALALARRIMSLLAFS